ncbi:MAG: hypothetical protein Unbinned6486contig1001_5 [Prokaryotic dsDNA virus sp.]|nr:MAG: hypothetical protein Unbinned6486contig1001_5 [Prokaryotic dsDNA virus sp.]|tara:strand:+ start:16955 stop:18241 length:1287 start_codon:yes stop_codon:yes gene_type:complete
MITYTGIIQYFQKFADQHMQINSFSEGAIEQIENRKITEYPLLHIIVSGCNIQDNTMIYDIDVYILTGIEDDKSAGTRQDAVSSTLMIMQDLRSEFFKGKYLLNYPILLQGSEDISCEPIEEDFQNRVYGWSTSISVTGVNESTQCNIPYHPTEMWNGTTFTSPVTRMANVLWFSGTEDVYSNATVTILSGSYRISELNYLVGTDVIQATNQPIRASAGGLHQYSLEKNGISLNNTLSSSGYFYEKLQTADASSFAHYTIGLKVSHISEHTSGSKYTSLFFIVDNHANPTKGLGVYVGASDHPTTAHRNKVVLHNIETNTYLVAQDISDGSKNFIRENNLTIILRVNGTDSTADDNKTFLQVDGINQLSPLTISFDESALFYYGVGTLVNASSFGGSYVLKELTLASTNGNINNNPDFNELYRWLNNR